MQNWTTWFEIPATDINRAKKFYDAVFQIDINLIDFGGLKMGIFPHKDTGAALCQHESYQPSDKKGLVVYLNANPDLQMMLDRVEPAGGKIIRPKSLISPEHGYMALFIDSEGNRMGLNSDK